MAAEEAFTALLQRIKKEQYVPTGREASLLYRTIYATYNPCATLWGFAGASSGYVLTRGNPSFLVRAGAVGCGCAYAQEFSWLLLDSTPAATFFRDVKGLTGTLRILAQATPLNTGKLSGQLRPGLIDFLSLDHVIGPTILRRDEGQAQVYSRRRGHSIVWLMLFDFDWVGEKQPFLRWYWRQQVRRVRLAYSNPGS